MRLATLFIVLLGFPQSYATDSLKPLLEDVSSAYAKTTKGPPEPKQRAVLGAFTVKPFLAQGAVIASERLGDYKWVAPVWENLRLIPC